MDRVAWRLGVVWMLVFAAVHVYWGFGGTGLLPEGVSVLDSLAMFVIDLVAIPLCLAGAALAWLLRPDQHPRRLLHRRWLLWPARVGSAVMLAHGIAGLGVVGLRLVSGEVLGEERWSLLYEPYWLLGGLLLAATVTCHRRAVRRVQSLQRNSREASAVATAPQTAITSHSPTNA